MISSKIMIFSEQIGGFGDKSMVTQVEKTLKIDISTFQEYDYMDNHQMSIGKQNHILSCNR